MLFADVTGSSIFLNVIIIVVSLLMMVIILVQRGKGGGLAGALGGAGGSSAFGSRAGDTFTKITLWMAAFWVLLIMFHVKVAQVGRAPTAPAAAQVDPAEPKT